VNDNVYIHELIDVIGHGRAAYMHHMTANWSPIGQDEREQRCFGVWGTVGSTGRWPEVVNMWEERGFGGLARSFAHETSRPSLQDEKLEKWWSEAAGLRRGGVDRLLVPAPWSPTIDELTDAGIRGEVYAHETISVPRGGSGRFLDLVASAGVEAHRSHGLELVGAFRTAMRDDDECIVIWAIPTWQHWAEFELAADRGALGPWVTARREVSTSFHRFLLVDAPLAPLRTGRQPVRSDRIDGWSEDPPTAQTGRTTSS
jgi:hypothetical protein